MLVSQWLHSECRIGEHHRWRLKSLSDSRFACGVELPIRICQVLSVGHPHYHLAQVNPLPTRSMWCVILTGLAFFVEPVSGLSAYLGSQMNPAVEQEIHVVNPTLQKQMVLLSGHSRLPTSYSTLTLGW